MQLEYHDYVVVIKSTTIVPEVISIIELGFWCSSSDREDAKN